MTYDSQKTTHGNQPSYIRKANPFLTTPKKTEPNFYPTASINQYHGNADLNGHIGSLGTIWSVGCTRFKPGVCATRLVHSFPKQTHLWRRRHMSSALRGQPTPTTPLPPRVGITVHKPPHTSTSFSVKEADQLDVAELWRATFRPLLYGTRPQTDTRRRHVSIKHIATQTLLSWDTWTEKDGWDSRVTGWLILQSCPPIRC